MRKVFPHFLFLFCMLFLTYPILNQDKAEKEEKKSEPILFDTYSEKSKYNESLLVAYADRFAKVLKESPKTTNGVIIFYQYEYEMVCSKETATSVKRYDFVRKRLIEKHKISPERILPKFGMWRELLELEFWVVPKNAKMPNARWHSIHDYVCGSVSITGTERVDSKTQFIYFTATVLGVDEVDYKWTVSAGKIVDGQGTYKIKVDISNLSVQEIKTTVDVQDVCNEFCEMKESFTTKIIQ